MTKNLVAAVLFVLALVPAVSASAQNAPPAPRYIAPGDLSLATLLPKWPADETLEGRADLDAVLAFQAYRSKAQEDAANADAQRGPVEWAQTILGSDFTAENLPVTTALVTDVHNDMRVINRAANEVHGLRPRPAIRNTRVKPSLPNVSEAENPSYPSARTASSRVWAYVLAEIFPSQREALFAAADRTAWFRLLGGAHYPTDLAAGRIVGEAAWEVLRRDEEFNHRLALAKTEAQTRIARPKP